MRADAIIVGETNASAPIDYRQDFMISLVLFCTAMLTVITVANLSVILALLRTGHKLKRMNFYIVNLAVADFLVGLVVVIPDILEKSKINYPPYNWLCKIHYTLSVAVTCNAAYALICVSIDRLLAVCRPLFVESRRVRFMLVGSSWLLGLLNGAPMLHFRQVSDMQFTSIHSNSSMTICATKASKHQSQAFVAFYGTVIFFLPLTIITGCYAIIIRVLWKKSSSGRTENTTSSSSVSRRASDVTVSVSTGFGHRHTTRVKKKGLVVRSDRSAELLAKATVRSVKMTLVIVAAYVSCWSPYFLFNLLSSIGVTKSPKLIIFMHSMGYLNSAGNPLIYWIFRTYKKL